VKRLLPLVAVGALSMAASACDLSAPAATVSGVTISRAQLDAQLSSVAGSPVAQCALTVLTQQNGTTLPTVDGSGDDTVTTAFADYELTGLVRQELEQRALAGHHAHVTAADVAAARQDYETELASATSQGSPCNLTGNALVARLPAAFLDEQARFLAADEKLEEVVGHVDVSPAGLRRYYDADPSAFTEQCLNLIAADDQAAAQAIHDQIAAGTSFAAASQGTGVSTNSPAGGQEPCVFPSLIQSQLGQSVAGVVAALAVGQVAPPQGIAVTNQQTGQTSTVWIVLGLRQRQLASFASVEPGLRLQLLQQGQWSVGTTLARLAAQVHVHLDPRYGTWSTRAGVTPPAPPPAGFVLNPAAGQPPAGASALSLGG
jgi:hypothetical protein